MDELERLIAAANPSPTIREASLSPRAEADLRRILQTPRFDADRAQRPFEGRSPRQSE